MKKFFTLCAAVLFAGMAFAATDDREIVTNYEFSGYDLRMIQIGLVWNYDASELVANSLVAKEDKYHVSTSMGNLYRKNNDGTYTAIPKQNNETLTEGVYQYRIQVRIDGDNGTKYRIPDKDKIESSATVKVNGQKWGVTSQYATISSDYCFFYIQSPDFKLIDNNISDYSLWQELWFAEHVAQGELNGKVFKAYGDTLQLSPVDPDNKMAIDGNTARFGDPADSASYYFRLKTGGTSSETKTFLTVYVPWKGQLRIAARTGKNSEKRSMIIMQNGVTIYNALLAEADTINIDGKRYYPYTYVDVEPGMMTISGFMNGINIYELAYRNEAKYGKDFNFPQGEITVGENGFWIVAVPEGADPYNLTDALNLMVLRKEVFGDFNTRDLLDPREMLTSCVFIDGNPLKVIAARGTVNSLSEELINVYGTFLCADFKTYSVNALIQVQPEGVKNVQSDKVQSTKVIRNGQLLIERNGRTYNANGIEVK